MTNASRESDLARLRIPLSEGGTYPPATSEPWERISIGKLFRHPLPGLHDTFYARLATRLILLALQPNMRNVRGLEHIVTENDPFLFVANHVSKVEAAILNALSHYVRNGRHIHFIADWNSQLFPFVGMVMRRAEVITVWKKPAKPRFLNILKPLYKPDEPPIPKAKRHLREGKSVGIYPEGTINHNRERLLRGHLGAAALALETGVPVVPLGTRIVEDGPENFFGPQLDFNFGAPMTPPAPAVPGKPNRDEVLSWHDEMMGRISELSGKSYRPRRVS